MPKVGAGSLHLPTRVCEILFVSADFEFWLIVGCVYQIILALHIETQGFALFALPLAFHQFVLDGAFFELLLLQLFVRASLGVTHSLG